MAVIGISSVPSYPTCPATFMETVHSEQCQKGSGVLGEDWMALTSPSLLVAGSAPGLGATR